MALDRRRECRVAEFRDHSPALCALRSTSRPRSAVAPAFSRAALSRPDTFARSASGTSTRVRAAAWRASNSPNNEPIHRSSPATTVEMSRLERERPSKRGCSWRTGEQMPRRAPLPDTHQGALRWLSLAPVSPPRSGVGQNAAPAGRSRTSRRAAYGLGSALLPRPWLPAPLGSEACVRPVRHGRAADVLCARPGSRLLIVRQLAAWPPTESASHCRSPTGKPPVERMAVLNPCRIDGSCER